jgi:peptidoglycan/LPS O-acetylase OafA/YrhL
MGAMTGGATGATSHDDPTAPLGYRPQLDGVRAVAIVLVMLFHTDKGARASLLPGGFLGVDVFFVLSGFLITSLLIDEDRSTGRIRLRAFWGRRVARLFPLLWALLAVMAFVRWVHPITGMSPPTPMGFVALLGYVGNWIPVTHRGSLMQLEYVWSLSVEEQFYVLWPLLVAGTLSVVARRRRTPAVPDGAMTGTSGQMSVGVLALAGALVVMVGRATVWHHTDYFFNTFLRADGLLLGAALAAARPWWQPRVRRLTANALVVVGTFLVARVVWVSRVGNPEMGTWRLPAVEVGVVLITIGLVARPGIAVARAIGTKPFVWLGRRAYSLYLVHLPIYDLVQAHFGEARPRMRMVWEWPLALLAAHVAHVVIELPAQRFLRRRLHAEHRPADTAPHDIETEAAAPA